MTNYNDGNWHGWNGGECPVHPETVVDLTIWKGAYGGGSGLDGGVSIRAGSISWSHVNSFRVIKEHKGPREWWVWNGRIFCDRKTAMRQRIHDIKCDHALSVHEGPIHVREVTE